MSSFSRRGMTRVKLGRIFSVLAFFACGANVVWAADLSQTSVISVLHLTNGDHVMGTLVSTTFEDCLGWQSPHFISPFHFSLGGLASIHFAAPSILPPAEGEYRVELVGGDVLYGRLEAMDASIVTLAVPGAGQLAINKTAIQRISRRNGGNEVLFVGPSGLNGWETPGTVGAWHEDAGHLQTEKSGAVLRRDFNLPELARIEFELSWTAQPDFDLAIAVDDQSKTISRAFKFDVWGSELVIQRETEQFADVVPLQAIEKSSRIHLQAFLNQKLGRMLVYSPAGKLITELTVATANPKVHGGLQLTNRSGDIRLERLQIGLWNGETPQAVDIDKSRIHENDGAITYGSLKTFDAGTRKFVIEEVSSTKSVAEDKIQDIFLSPAKDIPACSLRAVYLTGMKISGEITHVENRSAWLKSPKIREPIEIPFGSLQSILVLRPKTEPPQLPQTKGQLEIAGLTLGGCLVDGKKSDVAMGLVWQPQHSLTSSDLKKGTAARIIYHDPPKPLSPAVAAAASRPRGIKAIPERMARQITEPESPDAGKKRESILHLRTGDTIPCEVVSVDEQGLTFKSTISTATFVPHEQIHAVELDPLVDQKTIDPLKFDRLLTLPRSQRINPPTQLFRDLGGDYLRGRLIGINDAQIQIELRLEGKTVRRDRIARIIWLHPELMNAPQGDAALPNHSANSNLIQVLHSAQDAATKRPSQGNRLTFVPEKVKDSVLTGTSELFGACRVDLTKVDELLVGAAIDKVTAELPFGKWKLHSAAEPLEPKEGGEGSDSGEGQQSALIGKAAPDLNIKSVDGKKFNLKDHSSKVVILDFWASWCGPCMQVMPQIDKVAHEFAEQGVELFAVNIEESPERIQAALERLKLSPTVLMDRDGRAAERYGATSIPQTVIINRNGKVSRVFVGGGARFDEQLRQALKAVLAENEQN